MEKNKLIQPLIIGFLTVFTFILAIVASNNLVKVKELQHKDELHREYTVLVRDKLVKLEDFQKEHHSDLDFNTFLKRYYPDVYSDKIKLEEELYGIEIN